LDYGQSPKPDGAKYDTPSTEPTDVNLFDSISGPVVGLCGCGDETSQWMKGKAHLSRRATFMFSGTNPSDTLDLVRMYSSLWMNATR
jgi:hypothetical protein